MKKLLLALFLLGAFVAKAQIFAPPGAEWKYYYANHIFGPNGIVTIKYTGDTLINNIVCQRVSMYPNPYTNDKDPKYYWNTNYLFYSDSNAIYNYNWVAGSFIKVFDYNMDIGDSLMIYESYSCIDNNNIPVWYYTHIVDKGTDYIDGSPYRWIEYDFDGPIRDSNGNIVNTTSFRNYFFDGKYYEKLGFLGKFFQNQPAQCWGDYWFIECLSEYTDDSMKKSGKPKYYSKSCTINYEYSEQEDNVEEKALIYPNPVSNGAFTVTMDEPIAQVELINILGNIVFTTTNLHDPINTSSLSSGIYMVRIVLTDGTVDTQRIVVSN